MGLAIGRWAICRHREQNRQRRVGGQVGPDTVAPALHRKQAELERNGVGYTFTVIAFNAAGASVPSAVSASVTPAVSSISGITPPAANASAANAANAAAATDAAAANAAAANAAAVNAAAVNAAAANAASGPAVVPGGAPSTGAGGAFRSSSIREMGLGALALLLAGSAMLPAIRRRRA